MNHKIAILSDIHGNATALEAVIADAKNQGVSEYWLFDGANGSCNDCLATKLAFAGKERN